MSIESSKLAVDKDRFKIPGEAHLGEGSNFCQGFLISDLFGVLSNDSSGLGDIRRLLGLELEAVEVVGEPLPPLFLDISKSLAPLELNTLLSTVCFLMTGSGGLMRF